MSWATLLVRACTKIYTTRTSAFSTKSMNPMVGVLESLPATMSIMTQERSHQDFYSVGSGGLPLQGRLAHKGVSRKGLRLEERLSSLYETTDRRIKLRSYKATSAPTYILVGKGSTK
jgi:hypothetical protein